MKALADEYLQSWIYWQFKGYVVVFIFAMHHRNFYSYNDFTTQSSGSDEGLWFSNGTIQESKLFMLSRTYAQVQSSSALL